MNMNKSMVFKALKSLLRFVLMSLDVMLSIGASEPKRPRYGVLTAEELYKDGLISDAEYARHIYRNGRR